MKLYSTPLTLLTLALLLSSCYTPQAIIKVEPNVSENIFWYQGQPIAEAKKDSVITRAAFSHVNGQFFLFDVEVFNEKDTPILVSPEMMSLYVSKEFRIPAMDPEKIILSKAIKASKDEARRKNNTIIAGVVLVGAAVAVAANNSNNDNDSDNDDYQSSYYEDDNYTDENINTLTDVALPLIAMSVDFHQERILSTQINTIPSTEHISFWEQATLRKTTLRPGESIRGLVAFTRHSSSQLSLHIPIQKTEFEFLFNQQSYQPH